MYTCSLFLHTTLIRYLYLEVAVVGRNSISLTLLVSFLFLRLPGYSVGHWVLPSFDAKRCLELFCLYFLIIDHYS